VTINGTSFLRESEREQHLHGHKLLALFKAGEYLLTHTWTKEKFMVLAPKPKQPEKPTIKSLSEALQAECKSLRDRILKATNPEDAQTLVRQLDNFLKEIAQLQQDIGTIRRESGQHIQRLRQAKPKGRPAENEVRLIQGRNCVFVSGKWYPLEDTAKPDEGKEAA
jgi:prefoldin subunit 5